MILFRTDANPVIGFGHLTRCHALAHALRRAGERCVMAGPSRGYAPADADAVYDAWEPLAWNGAQQDAVQLRALAERHGCSGLVLDYYCVDEAYQRTLKQHGLKWLQFEARTDRPLWADLVVNANPAAQPQDYAAVLRNPATRLLLGPSYATLRPEFSEVQQRDHSRPVRRILLTFGGGDDRGAILFSLQALLPVLPAEIGLAVLSGAHNPRNAEIAQWITAHGRTRVELKINPQGLADLFAGCDLAVMAGGTTTYEAVCCGLPMILVAIADNQLSQSRAWEQLGAARFLGLHPGVSAQALCDAVLHHLQFGVQVRRRQQPAVACDGADRVAREMTVCFAAAHGASA